MKRSLICILIYSLYVLPAMSQERRTADSSDQAVRRVVTAMDHLTVLEYGEPVTMAAAGSPAFQIERQDSKVFVKPLRSGVSTNLFVWTASDRFVYELTVGDQATMNARILSPVPKPAPVDTGAKLEELAEAQVRETLLAGREIDSGEAKLPKNRVRLRVERIFPSRSSLYIQYSLENLSGESYDLPAPALYQLQAEHPRINPLSLRAKQLDRQAIEELGSCKQLALSIARSVSGSDHILPGKRGQGLLAVRRPADLSKPLVLELVFDTNVKATVVF